MTTRDSAPLVVSPTSRFASSTGGTHNGLFSADPGTLPAVVRLADIPARTYKGKFSPYWLTIKDGVVVTIEEQYQP